METGSRSVVERWGEGGGRGGNEDAVSRGDDKHALQLHRGDGCTIL